MRRVWTIVDMKDTTLRIMASVERRLNRLLYLESTACGYEEDVAKANAQRDRLEAFLEREIETLAQKAGVS